MDRLSMRVVAPLAEMSEGIGCRPWRPFLDLKRCHRIEVRIVIEHHRGRKAVSRHANRGQLLCMTNGGVTVTLSSALPMLAAAVRDGD